MGLEKALIQPLDERGRNKGKPVKVMFNPGEYAIEKRNAFSQAAVPGLSVPILQFVNGHARTLKMDLFFDTCETRKDVRSECGQVVDLMQIDRDMHVPPLCKFIWGRLEFKAVLECVSQRYTMFLDSGIPVRATLHVAFREYKTLEEDLYRPPRQSADKTKRRATIEGDHLWRIADREYNDPSQWRLIARANGISNPRHLPPGMDIMIPPLE